MQLGGEGILERLALHLHRALRDEGVDGDRFHLRVLFLCPKVSIPERRISGTVGSIA